MKASRPRILNFVTRLNIGGPAVYTILLTEGLLKYGFDARLLVGEIEESEGDMMNLAYERGVEPLIISSLKREIRPLSDGKSILQCYNILKEFSPHILHTHTSKAGLVGRLAALIQGTPLVLHTFHGHVFSRYFGLLKSSVFVNLERFLAHFSTFLITLSPRLKEELARKYHITSDQKILSLALGLDLEPFRRAQNPVAIRQEFSVPSDSFLIGSVGRLVDIKNHSLLLRSFGRLSRQVPQARLMFLGDGPLRSELEGEARALGIEEKLIITGYRQDTPSFYQAFDVLALSSKQEGTPLVILEAFASSVPVVATSVGGVADLFSHLNPLHDRVVSAPEGILVPSEDEESLFWALKSLFLDREERLMKGKSALARSFEYDASLFIKRIVDLYDHLLQRKRL